MDVSDGADIGDPRRETYGRRLDQADAREIFIRSGSQRPAGSGKGFSGLQERARTVDTPQVVDLGVGRSS